MGKRKDMCDFVVAFDKILAEMEDRILAEDLLDLIIPFRAGKQTTRLTGSKVVILTTLQKYINNKNLSGTGYRKMRKDSYVFRVAYKMDCVLVPKQSFDIIVKKILYSKGYSIGEYISIPYNSIESLEKVFVPEAYYTEDMENFWYKGEISYIK